MSRAPASLRPAPEWDGRTGRMIVLSAGVHLLVFAALVMVGPLMAPMPQPMIAYTVELTDGRGLGGRIPAGAPGKGVAGGPAAKPAPPEPPAPPAEEPSPPPTAPPPTEPPPPPKPDPAPAEPPPPPPAPEPQPKPVAPEEPAVRIPEKPKPEPPKPEPPKAEPPKPEQPKPTPPKPEPAKPAPVKPEPRKPPTEKPQPPKPEAKPTAKPEPSPPPKPAAPAETKPAARSGSAAKPGGEPQDAYAAAAQRFQGQHGNGGMGGTDTRGGPIGSGGDGGGGGQLVGLEFLAYKQRVENVVRENWTNVAGTPGLVARVRFEIAADGGISGVRIEQGSGNAAYDASVQRAVLRSNPLPPPPGKYANEFREFVIEFHSEDKGGMGAG